MPEQLLLPMVQQIESEEQISQAIDLIPDTCKVIAGLNLIAKTTLDLPDRVYEIIDNFLQYNLDIILSTLHPDLYQKCLHNYHGELYSDTGEMEDIFNELYHF
ncbi:MAG: hypothetical protein ACXADW_21850 [Candidatus Hodarchaeales archaeon]|jgi:beta-xylosidase